MAVQRKTDLSNKPFILTLMALIKGAEVVVQDAGRSGDMLINTLMVKDPATGKWTSFTDETGTDGTQFPRGILRRELTEAEIKAGDVSDVPILVGDAVVDSAHLVIENSKTLATVINVPVNINVTVEDFLAQLGIWMESTIDTTAAA